MCSGVYSQSQFVAFLIVMLLSFRILILWLHLLAAVVWIGGLVFQLLVVRPALRRIPPSMALLRFSVSLEIRFRYMVWPAVGLVLLTGLYNVMNVLYTTALAGGSVPSAFVRLLSLKLPLVVLMIAMQAVQRFFLNPRMAASLTRLPPGTAEPPSDLMKHQRLSHLLNVVIVGVAVVVMLLGLLLYG